LFCHLSIKNVKFVNKAEKRGITEIQVIPVV